MLTPTGGWNLGDAKAAASGFSYASGAPGITGMVNMTMQGISSSATYASAAEIVAAAGVNATNIA